MTAMLKVLYVTKIFCIADDFCSFFDSQMQKYTFKSDIKCQYHRSSTMSKAEIMMIMILFHSSGYRCLKHFYLEQVCKHMRHLFPEVVSYNRFVELEREVALPLIIFIKEVLLGKCTGISFVDNTPTDDKNYLELDLLSDLVADYEEEYYPIAAPTLVETLKLRMYEMGHQVAGHILHTVATTEVDACQ